MFSMNIRYDRHGVGIGNREWKGCVHGTYEVDVRRHRLTFVTNSRKGPGSSYVPYLYEL